MEFAAFPIVFEDTLKWPQNTSGLSFLGMMIGQILGCAYSVLDDGRYKKVADRTPYSRPPPESRLIPAMVGAVTLPIGLFWFAWTNFPSIHWIVCEIGTVLFGFSHVSIFLSIVNYLVDGYTIYAASALAGNAVIRALFGAALYVSEPSPPNMMYKADQEPRQPSLYHSNVSESWNPLGFLYFGLPCHCLLAIPMDLLQVRTGYPPTLPICC